ncbi:MAG: hypothetical protein ACI9QQ_000249 [Myxococcota bacterium]
MRIGENIGLSIIALLSLAFAGLAIRLLPGKYSSTSPIGSTA